MPHVLINQDGFSIAACFEQPMARADRRSCALGGVGLVAIASTHAKGKPPITSEVELMAGTGLLATHAGTAPWSKQLGTQKIAGHIRDHAPV